MANAFIRQRFHFAAPVPTISFLKKTWARPRRNANSAYRTGDYRLAEAQETLHEKLFSGGRGKSARDGI